MICSDFTFHVFLKNTVDVYSKKYEAVCLFCGNAESLLEFKGKKLCKSCADAINNAL